MLPIRDFKVLHIYYYYDKKINHLRNSLMERKEIIMKILIILAIIIIAIILISKIIDDTYVAFAIMCIPVIGVFYMIYRLFKKK